MTLSSSRTLAFAALPSFPVNEFPVRASREVGGAGHPATLASSAELRGHRSPRPPAPRVPQACRCSARSPRTARGPCGQASPRPRPRPPRPLRAAPRPRQPAEGRGAHEKKRPKAPRLCAYLSARCSSSSSRRGLGEQATRTRHPGFPQRGVWASYAAREEPRPERAPPSSLAARQRHSPARQTRPLSATTPPTWPRRVPPFLPSLPQRGP